MRAVISRKAEDDLAIIYANITAKDPEAAERFRRQATKALDLLAEHPGLGPRPGWKTRHSRLRFWVVSRFHNYLIFYETGEDRVSIERVLDGRRDVRRIIDEHVEYPPTPG
jgi:plasmid stabilization system protein ParE